MDTTEGTGRAIFRGLNEIYPAENLCWVSFNEKLDVDFEKDEFGRLVFKEGNPVYKEEFVTDWSIIRMKILLYDRLFELPLDFKLELQITSVVSMISGKRNIYQCLAEEDHLFSAFRCFAIAQWQYEFHIARALKKKKFDKMGV